MSQHYYFCPVSEEWLEWCRVLHNDPQVLKNLTNPREVLPYEQKQWFEKIKDNPRWQYNIVFLQDDDGFSRPIGVIRMGWDYENSSVCIGLDIHRDWRGKHHARPIYDKMMKEIFQDMIWTNDGAQRVWLQVAEYNTVARTLYTSLGLKEEGHNRKALNRDGVFYDYITMSILRDEYFQLHPESNSAVQSTPSEESGGNT